MVAVAIIGAGPYGLSLAAHLSALGVEHRVFGHPLATWRDHVPAGMSLKSDGFASNLSEPSGAGTLAAYCAAHQRPYHDTDRPVALADFNAYASDFQQRFVPELEDCEVVLVDRKGTGFRLELDTGEVLEADIVVTAVGITYFARTPEELAGLPAELASHSSAYGDLSGFAGRDVTVIGAGSSAVDTAALISEAGAASVSLIARTDRLLFSDPPAASRSRWHRLRHPQSGIGPGVRSWLFQRVPHLFRFLPASTRLSIVRQHLGPKSAWVMKPRLEAGVSVSLGERLVAAHGDGGRVRLVLEGPTGARREHVTDHVIAATGYSPQVDALPFLSDGLRRTIRTHEGMAVLDGGFESSARGLYFVGPAAVNSFGPLMRFMVGAEYAAPRLAGRLARRTTTPARRGRRAP